MSRHLSVLDTCARPNSIRHDALPPRGKALLQKRTDADRGRCERQTTELKRSIFAFVFVCTNAYRLYGSLFASGLRPLRFYVATSRTSTSRLSTLDVKRSSSSLEPKHPSSGSEYKDPLPPRRSSKNRSTWITSCMSALHFGS